MVAIRLFYNESSESMGKCWRLAIFVIWLMSRFNVRSWSHFWSIKGLISFRRLSLMDSRLRFGQSKLPWT
jgi:hypothetical protein